MLKMTLSTVGILHSTDVGWRTTEQLFKSYKLVLPGADTRGNRRLQSRVPIIRHSFYFIWRAVSKRSILSTVKSICRRMNHTDPPRTAKYNFLYFLILYRTEFS